jgi:hypothetical protein
MNLSNAIKYLAIGAFASMFFLSLDARAANNSDIPMKLVWEGSEITPDAGGETREQYGRGWWGFWNNNYPASKIRKLVMMSYTRADYAMKTGFDSLKYIPGRYGKWTYFDVPLWNDYKEISSFEVSAKGDDWDILYFRPVVNATIVSRNGHKNWLCASVSSLWAGRKQLFSMTTCFISSFELNYKSIQDPIMARAIIESFGTEGGRYEPSYNSSSTVLSELLNELTVGYNTKKDIDKKNINSPPRKMLYCQKNDGSVFSSMSPCDSGTQITISEFRRIKAEQAKSNIGDSSSQVGSDSDEENIPNSIEAKLEKLKLLLDKGLITSDEADEKRMEILDEL